jgi:hypothetical protein
MLPHMTDIATLHARLQELEKIVELLVEAKKQAATLNAGAALRANARLTATTSILREVCLHFGLTDEEFAQHLSGRTSYYHDTLLSAIRAKDPNLAGRVDNRNLDEVSTDRPYPPLFIEE